MDNIDLKKMREAFSIIDGDQDGVIDINDLAQMHIWLEKNVSNQYLEQMLTLAPRAVGIQMFLMLLIEPLKSYSLIAKLFEAFVLLDDQNHPEKEFTMDMNDLMGYLTHGEEALSQEEIQKFLRIAPIDAEGRLNYRQFADAFDWKNLL